MGQDLDVFEEMLRMISLPSDWQMKPLKEVATLQRGFDLPVNDRVEGDVPVFAANGPVGTHNVAKIKGPGVVTGRSGTLGKVHLVESDYWPLNTALWVKDFHGNDPNWVFRLLSWMKLEDHTRGTGVPTLNRNLVHVVEVPLPPLAEQRRIAAILDKADAIRRKRKQAIQYTEELLRATFLDMFGDPVTNPKGWETKSLESISERIIDCPHSTPKWTDEGVICLRTSNLTEGGWNWDDTRFVTEEDYKERTSRSEILPGDIVLSREGTVGIAAIVPPDWKLCMGQRLVQIRPEQSKITSLYLLQILLWQLSPERIGQLMRGSTSQHLNVKDLRSMKVRVPPISLQEQFSKIAAQLEAQNQKLVSSVQEKEYLFNSLLQRAFRGEL
jgi:type I restriction enzyme S subunit